MSFLRKSSSDFLDFFALSGQMPLPRLRPSEGAGLRCDTRGVTAEGNIAESRYRSYVKLYELSAQHKFWEYKDE